MPLVLPVRAGAPTGLIVPEPTPHPSELAISSARAPIPTAAPTLRERRSATAGARKVAARLADRRLADVALRLPDRQVVVGPAGIFVVDAWRCRKAAVSVRQSEGGPELIVAGRDRTPRVALVAGRIPGLRAALASSVEFLATPIMPVVCFVDADLTRTDLEVDGVRVRDLDGLIALVSTPGSLEAPARERLARHLGRPAAS